MRQLTLAQVLCISGAYCPKCGRSCLSIADKIIHFILCLRDRLRARGR